MINTRKHTKFWPFKRSVLENFISFTSKPYTTKNARLRFYTVQKDTQEKTSRQSSQREAAKQTVIEIVAWWIKAGFLRQSSNGLTAKLLTLVNEQKQLSQDHLKIQKKKITPTIQQKQRLFLRKSKETFWAVRKECEEYLRTAAQEFTNSKRKEKLQEDWQFL